MSIATAGLITGKVPQLSQMELLDESGLLKTNKQTIFYLILWTINVYILFDGNIFYLMKMYAVS